MPIDRKRRIFRPGGLTGLTLSRASRRVTMTVLIGGLILGGGVWLALQPSQAPASSAPPGRLIAAADHIRVLDAETLLLGDRVVQLAGVQAPARGMACPGPGTPADCGAAAANALSRLIGRAVVECALHGAGAFGRPLAVCSAGGLALNQAIVAAGWSRTTAPAGALADAESKARAAGLGLWGPGHG